MDYFKILPAEITLDILTRLPTESVLDSKLVCTNWRNLISHHPLFYKMYLQHLNHPSADSDSGELGFLAFTRNRNFYYFAYNDESKTPVERIRRMNFFTPPFKNIKFVGSCNGLICLSENQSVWICNPITREYVKLPEIKSEICDIDGRVYRGNSFGFVSSTNEYKVLGIYVNSFSSLEVHIYTLGSGNGWRYLGSCNSEFQVCNYNWEEAGVFANETLYWMDDRSIMIANFDLAQEKFCEHLSPPRLLLESEWWCSSIGILNGCFYFVIPVDGKSASHEVWLLRKKNYNDDIKERDEHQSVGWIKEFGVDHCQLLAVTKSKCILTFNGNYLNIYDPKASTSKMLVDFKERIREVFPHKNTLLSLNELREEGTKTMMQLKGMESMIRLSSS